MRGIPRFVLPAALALFASTAARADVIIDNFTTATPTISVSSAPGSATSSAISGAGILGTRTIAVNLAASPLSSVTAQVAGGFATAGFSGVYTPANTANSYTLTENFASQNATGAGLNQLSFFFANTLPTTVTITANGSSTAMLNLAANGVGATQTVLFSAFTSNVFGALTSLSFVETFPTAAGAAPSVSFSNSVLLGNSVPEPSPAVLAGLASGLFGVGRLVVRRKRTA
jgi:hypothetical protein